MEYDIVVIGAGISGSSFAFFSAQRGKRVLILEKNERLGGALCSQKNSTQDYWVDLGAHTCYNSYNSFIKLIKSLQLGKQIAPLAKLHFFFYENHQLKSVISKLNIIALFYNLILKKASKESSTVKQYYSKKVGTKNYENVLKYAFRAVISQIADDFPADIFLKKRKYRNKKIPKKFSIHGGMQSVVEKISKSDNIETINNFTINQIVIDYSGNRYTITSTNENDKIQTKNIAIATPPLEAARLLLNIAPDIAKTLNKYTQEVIVSISVVIAKENIKVKKVAGIIFTSDNLYSAVSRDKVDHSSLRAFTFHFKKETQIEKYYTDKICEVLSIKKEDIVDTKIVENSLPRITMNNNIQKLIVQCNNMNNLYVVGNYFYGLSIEDCVNRSLDESERYLKL
ncbi:MAG: hypothetical protein AUJ97_07260 [Bacteroidetes bacterium CG2_30_32_10]|nr:MAG: hypothetical protein AUJ97_07260 [Bacteroidetes bacterium CG2_30_32_10]